MTVISLLVNNRVYVDSCYLQILLLILWPMTLEIRKFVTFDEEILIEGFKKSDHPWRLFAVAAVIKNPWAGRFVEDLKPEIYASVSYTHLTLPTKA